jgi:SAM-dependent methyltransferase
MREAVLGPIDRIDALIAQSDYRWRGENEKKHFSAVYRDSFYADRPVSGISAPGASQREFVPFRAGRVDDSDSRLRNRLSCLPPLPDETVFAYSMRLLQDLLPGTAPDFSGRIRARAADLDRPLRILSLCSGAARIEQALTAPCSSTLEIVLFDINEDLLRLAASGFAARHRVSYVVGDINGGLPDVGEVDFVICVSALHHVLRLEQILSEINDCLMDDGQFLSIGEYVGRNGSRLWPREFELAARFFRSWEPRLRYHRFFGKQLEQLPNDDCSLTSYEGARSEELLDMLRGHLVPVHEYLRNTFMWRLIDPALAPNFDLTRPDDLELVREIVASEAGNWLAGGKCTELHAVYGKKKLNV